MWVHACSGVWKAMVHELDVSGLYAVHELDVVSGVYTVHERDVVSGL